MTTLIAITGALLAAALQARMPGLSWLAGVRLEFVPAVVVYGSFTLRRKQALLLAALAAMAQDALSAGPFGLSVLAYGLAALLITATREVLDRDLPWVQFGAGAMTCGTVAVLQFFVVGISFTLLFKLMLVALITGIVTVVLFFALDYFRLLWAPA